MIHSNEPLVNEMMHHSSFRLTFGWATTQAVAMHDDMITHGALLNAPFQLQIIIAMAHDGRPP